MYQVIDEKKHRDNVIKGFERQVEEAIRAYGVRCAPKPLPLKTFQITITADPAFLAETDRLTYRVKSASVTEAYGAALKLLDTLPEPFDAEDSSVVVEEIEGE